MFDKNTMSKIQYINENIFWGIVAMLLYIEVCYENIFNFGKKKKKKFLYVLFVVFVVIGILVTWKKRRNSLSVLVNVISAPVIYTVLVYMSYLYSTLIAISVFSLILCAFYAVPILCRKTKLNIDETKRKHIQRQRLRYALLGTRTIATLCFAVIIVNVAVGSITGNYIYEPKVAVSNNSIYSEEYTIANNIEILEKLSQEEWNKLNLEQKLDVLQVVCNIERNELGVDNPIYIRSGILDETVLGQYEDDRHLVVIDIEHLKNDTPVEVLTTTIHECYHSYQKRLVELYNNSMEKDKNLFVFDRIKKYEYEFKYYVSENTDEYYYQTVETDARAYSEIAVLEYYKEISKHV